MSAALPEGFVLHRAWCSLALVDLVDSLDWEQREVTVYSKSYPTPRLTAWYGEVAYAYSGVRHEPRPMPEVLSDVRDHLERLTGARFNSVLANLYRDGSDSVAWHSDDEVELGTHPTIASLSVGSTRNFRVKERETRYTGLTSGRVWKCDLADGDLLVMSGRSQLDYLHSVPKTVRDCGPRVNLTYRWVD